MLMVDCVFTKFTDTCNVDYLYLFIESILISNRLDSIHILIYTSNNIKNIIQNSSLWNENIIFDTSLENDTDIYKKLDFQKYNTFLYINSNSIINCNLKKLLDVNDDKLIYVLRRNIGELMIFKSNDRTKSIINNIFFSQNDTREFIINENNIFFFNNHDKYTKMSSCLKNIKENLIHKYIQITKEYVSNHLIPIVKSSGELLEGNIFFIHKTLNYDDRFISKVKNISNILLNKNIIHGVMEIGFNAGFSSLLMLITNPYIELTCFDLGFHTYMLPCFYKLRETFGNRINLIKGDSVETLKNHLITNKKYDLIHIDGGHSEFVATNDIENSYKLSKKGTIFIMDDTDFHELNVIWNNKVIEYKLENINTTIDATEYHDIKYRPYL